jgi:thymidine phosphorylase
MLVLGGKVEDEEQGMVLARTTLESGEAWERFRILVSIQGGDTDYIDYPERLPAASWIEKIPSPRTAYLTGVHACLVGETSVMLGAGRTKKDDPIDPAVGVIVHHKGETG